MISKSHLPTDYLFHSLIKYYVFYSQKTVIVSAMERRSNKTKDENASRQQAVWQYGGATNIFSTLCSLFGYSSSRRIMPSDRITNELLFINLAAVMDRRFSKTATSPSRDR